MAQKFLNIFSNLFPQHISQNIPQNYILSLVKPHKLCLSALHVIIQRN